MLQTAGDPADFTLPFALRVTFGPGLGAGLGFFLGGVVVGFGDLAHDGGEVHVNGMLILRLHRHRTGFVSGLVLGGVRLDWFGRLPGDCATAENWDGRGFGIISL